MGVVVLALFAISNPLLHIAKICNQLNLGVVGARGQGRRAAVRSDHAAPQACMLPRSHAA